MSRVVLVTGSTSGIGEATARRFAAAGDSVVLNSARSVEAGERLAGEIPGSCYVRADISDTDDCDRLVAEVASRFGRLDVLVNNAGTTEFIAHRDLAAATVDVWRRIYEVNVFGTWQLTVAAMELLRASKGSVVNVTSLAGVRQLGSSIPYATSKAALNHLTSLLAKVVGPDVRVNAVAPGQIDTPWHEGRVFVNDFVAATAPLKRVGTPDDVAEVIVALSAASYLTGQVVVVDGGLSLAT